MAVPLVPPTVPRGFLAALATGADLVTALQVAEAGSKGRAKARLATVREAASKGDHSALFDLGGIFPKGMVTVILAASDQQRPAVAERLLGALSSRPERLEGPAQGGKLWCLILASISLVGLFVPWFLKRWVQPVFQKMSEDFHAPGLPMDPASFPVASALFVTALILVAGFFVYGARRPVPSIHWTYPRRILAYLAAGVEAGLEPRTVLEALTVPRSWMDAAEAGRSTAALAEALSQKKVLPAAVARVAAFPLAGDRPGANWARAATLFEQHHCRRPTPDWPAYVALLLAALGTAVVVLQLWGSVVQLAGVF